MIKNLGISIYPEKSSFEKIEKYLELCAEKGFKFIFTNFLQIDSDNKDVNLEKIKKMSLKANSLGLKVFADINTNIWKIINAENNLNIFERLGLQGIRLDHDFGGEKEALISKNKHGINIQLNGSSWKKTPSKTLSLGGLKKNISICFNFYPQRYTGMSEKDWQNQAKHFINIGLPIYSFVTTSNKSKSIGPWDTNEGLPTIEIHRDLTIDYQMRYYVASNLVDYVLVSTMHLSEEELDEMVNVDLLTPTLEIVAFKEISSNELEILKLKNKNSYRQDSPKDFIRSVYSRDKINKQIKPRACNKEFFEPGDVVILNSKYLEYEGELQIIKNRVRNHGKKNLVGTLSSNEMKIVNLLERLDIFNFKVKKS